MILPITLPLKSSSGSTALPPVLTRLGSSELFLLELQGELDVSGDKHGQLVGRLTIDDDAIDGKVRALSFTLPLFPLRSAPHFSYFFKGKPTLRIGHHLLEGKIVSLPKPLAVLQRICAPPPLINSHDNECDGNGDDVQHDDNGGDSTKDDNKTAPVATSYAIRTLIRKKIVFSKRPTPIVGLSAKIT